MNDVFVSYTSKDRARVKPLVDALTAAGLSVWWDVYIEGGTAWRDVITEKLDGAACVLVVWSTQSVGPAGRFVQDEASHGDARGVYLPVAIDAVQPPLGFGQQQVLPLVGWTGNRRDPHFTDILHAVQAMISGGPKPVPHASPAMAARPRPRWPLPVSAGLGALLLIAAGVYQFAPLQLCTGLGIACARSGQNAPANSIAVLPFANLSGDPGQDYFSDGLSEELISNLARLEKLQVAARTSSFKFKGSKDATDAIAAKLGVFYLLDGSVRRNGRVVRVNAQLVEGRTGFERWSQTYDRDMKDIFAVQSGIAESVADALQVKILGEDIAALSRGGTKDPAAWDAYLRGRQLFDSGGGEHSYRTALARFDAAIAADPDFAAAHAARSRTLVALANQFTDNASLRSTYDAALVSAQRAVALAPALTDAQTSLAVALVNAKFDFAGARAAYDRAIETGAGDADTLTRYGLFAVLTGDTTPGLAALHRAVTLDPLNPRAYKSLGIALLAARRYDAAIAAQRRALELSPDTASAHAEIAKALYLQGKLAAASTELAREPQDWERQTGQAIVLRKRGDRAGAEAARRALIGDGGDNTAYQEAQIAAQWGDTAPAIAALDAAFKAGDTGVILMKTDPLLDPLRASPAFAAQIARLGLTR